MKIKSIGLMFMCFFLVTGLNNCSDPTTLTYTANKQVDVYLSLEDIRTGFKVEAAKTLEEPGKIYVYKHLLFINQKSDGVHIVDNSDPSNPIFLSYLRIPGNTDIAIKNNLLFANSGPDLLVLNMADINKVEVVTRKENAFFESNKKVGDTYWVGVAEKEEVVKRYSSRGWNYAMGIHEDVPVLVSNDKGVGIGGSMARFVLADDYLYFVDDSKLIPIDISNANSPMIRGTVLLNRGTIETLYKYKEYLFVGSMTGVFILDYKSNPAAPYVLSSVQHVRSCDPVVVQDDIAFSTLSSFTRCGGGNNELMVLDVKNAAKPSIIAEYFFDDTPLGLGVNNDNLFVCMGNSGFNWFKTTDLKNIDNNIVAKESAFHAYDIIVFNDHLIVTGNNGIAQFAYDAEKGKITRLSTLMAK